MKKVPAEGAENAKVQSRRMIGVLEEQHSPEASVAEAGREEW